MIRSISKSSLITFLRCAAQWEQIHIYDRRIPPGIAGRRGGSLHKAAEINFKQKKTSKADLPVGDLMDAARDHYIHTINQNGVFIPKNFVSEKSKLLNEGLNATIRLTKLYREEAAPKVQPVLVEEKLEIDAGLPWPIVGIIDVYSEDKRLPDYKSASKSPSKGVADTSLDLTFYAGLVAHHTGEWPEEVSLDYLIDLKDGAKYSSQVSKRGPEDWANLMLRVQLMAQQIEAGIFAPCDPSSWVCSPNYCGFFRTCRYSIKRR